MPADSASPTPASFRSHRPAGLMSASVGEILWDSAKEALFTAFLVGLLGSIAIGILSGICGEMTPSPPPGLQGRSALNHAAAHWWQASRNAFHRHSFAILFVALFAAKSALRLAPCLTHPGLRQAAALALRATRRLSRDWFSFLIRNAFAAFAGVLVLQVAQNFSLTHWLWETVWSGLYQVLAAAARLVGWGLPGLLESWTAWFGDNQTKFSFWLLFSAALCDDLGLPNYKTLARRAWKRICGSIP